MQETWLFWLRWSFGGVALLLLWLVVLPLLLRQLRSRPPPGPLRASPPAQGELQIPAEATPPEHAARQAAEQALRQKLQERMATLGRVPPEELALQVRNWLKRSS